ncbi:MAG TPA: hypothetical protein VFC39_13735 [Acidobacteriaceae bacterium]|nr:hypothetical protein [Acidobacteriaceae bacterium]
MLNTLDEINTLLPNGLHDAEIEIVTHDLRNRSLELRVFVWVGTMGDPPSQRERYRLGKIRFEQVEMFAISPPRGQNSGELTILSLEIGATLLPEFKPADPFGETSYRIFFGYTEMDIAAARIHFEWISTEEINRSPESEP